MENHSTNTDKCKPGAWQADNDKSPVNKAFR